MKFLLTSAGLTTPAIIDEMWRLLDVRKPDLRVFFCTTASNYAGGNMADWMVNNLITFKNLGFEIDVCDIRGAANTYLFSRIEAADILYFEGGDVQWLMQSLNEERFKRALLRQLENKLWIGASAGSLVVCPTIVNPILDLFEETDEMGEKEGLDLVKFHFVPHLNSPRYPKITEKSLKPAIAEFRQRNKQPLYICDDNTAISVYNTTVEVICPQSVIVDDTTSDDE
jgi:dipeptidase E